MDRSEKIGKFSMADIDEIRHKFEQQNPLDRETVGDLLEEIEILQGLLLVSDIAIKRLRKEPFLEVNNNRDTEK
jgi:hypothetical protein